MDEITRKKRILNAKGRLLWRLILNTPGTEDLEKPWRNLAKYDDLAKPYRITIATVLTEYEAGCRAIEQEIADEDAAEKAVAAQAIQGAAAAVVGVVAQAASRGRTIEVEGVGPVEVDEGDEGEQGDEVEATAPEIVEAELIEPDEARTA